MPHPCAVCGRSRMNPNNRLEEYVFFGFPVNDEIRCRQWLEFCCRDDLYKLSRKQLLQRMICSKHFVSTDFLSEYLERLNSTAVPSVYDPKQSLYNIICVVCGESRKDPPTSNDDSITFHHFPAEEFRCLEWLDFVGVDSYYRLTRKEILYCYICSKHFDRSQFVLGYKGRLVENAVPNIRDVDQPTLTVAEPTVELKLFSSPERCKKLDSLPNEILESLACVACGRLRSDPRNKLERYKFHPFPAYEIGRCLRWCQFLGREDLLKMSPNQIRKLVLCSRHFEANLSFHKGGPCDAVPTIKNISESVITFDEEQDGNGDINDSSKALKPCFRPLVSSKKPKIDNKPTPLAKKRGKSRRPTSVNIPKSDPDNLESRIIRKLPLPSRAGWQIQINDQFQPITLSNIAPNTTNNLQTGIKKVIMPFIGDISNLGAPIPVRSLSSMPPGLLIKINLPEQEQEEQEQQQQQKPTRAKRQNKIIKNTSNEQTSLKNNNPKCIILQQAKQNVDKNVVGLLSMYPESIENNSNSDEINIKKDIMEIVNENEEQEYFDELETTEIARMKKKEQRRKTTSIMRNTMFPITSEAHRFLKRLAPLIRRLPKKSRARVKLSIVNMVIDHF